MKNTRKMPIPQRFIATCFSTEHIFREKCMRPYLLLIEGLTNGARERYREILRKLTEVIKQTIKSQGKHNRVQVMLSIRKFRVGQLFPLGAYCSNWKI